MHRQTQAAIARRAKGTLVFLESCVEMLDQKIKEQGIPFRPPTERGWPVKEDPKPFELSRHELRKLLMGIDRQISQLRESTNSYLVQGFARFPTFISLCCFDGLCSMRRMMSSRR